MCPCLNFKGLTGNKTHVFSTSVLANFFSYIVGNFSNTGKKGSFSIDCQTLCFNSNFLFPPLQFLPILQVPIHIQPFLTMFLVTQTTLIFLFLLYLTNRLSHTIQIINHFGLFAYCLLCIHLFSQRSIISNSRIDSLLTAYTVGYWGACVALLGAIC